MDLTPYVDSLREELLAAAEAGGDDARRLAERLVAPLDTSTRLALLEALSAAADEITSDLAPGSVEVRLRGRNPDFVVTPPPPEPPEVDAAMPPQTSLRSALANAVEVTMGVRPPASGAEPDEGGTSRVTLRLPEHLKPRIDEAAARSGLSVNAWLVRVIAAALEPADHPGTAGAVGPTGPGPGNRHGAGRGATGPGVGRRYTGWVR